jgi:hypothetical protein
MSRRKSAEAGDVDNPEEKEEVGPALDKQGRPIVKRDSTGQRARKVIG